MSRDADLIVTCACGCIEIIKKNGYHTHDLTYALTMGATASHLCRHRLRWLMRVGAVLLVACLAGVGVTAWVENRRVQRMESAEYHRGVGENCLEAKDYDGALAAFAKSIAIHAEAKTHLFMGFAYMMKKEYAKAVGECDKAIVIEPTNEAAIENRKIAHSMLTGGDGNPPCASKSTSP